jgi:hypothetical protein
VLVCGWDGVRISSSSVQSPMNTMAGRTTLAGVESDWRVVESDWKVVLSARQQTSLAQVCSDFADSNLDLMSRCAIRIGSDWERPMVHNNKTEEGH